MRAQKAYPGIKVTADASEVISSAAIDAVAVVTPYGRTTNWQKLHR
jgi:hypothetical protein